jgi:hypothetical protein
MDWKQVEDEFALWHLGKKGSKSVQAITEWFKNRIESAQIVPTIEDKIEYENINVTADVKPNYGK